MSPLLEDNFEWTPEYTKKDYAEAFSSFFNNIIFRQSDEVIRTANILENLPTRLTTGLEILAHDMESIFLGSYEQEDISSMEIAVENSLRAYVYSGSRIDAELVKDVAWTIGKDDEWLKEILVPTNHLLSYLVKNEVSEEEKDCLRYYGRRALVDLGLAKPYIKFLVRIDKSRITKLEAIVPPLVGESAH